MNSETQKSFDPNKPGNTNAGVFGMSTSFSDADIVILPAPWEVTASYRGGTAYAPESILKASPQLDLVVPGIDEAWKTKVFFGSISSRWADLNNKYRARAIEHIRLLEKGAELLNNDVLVEINSACDAFRSWVFEESTKIIQSNKKVALLGGDHSCALGLIQAVSMHEKKIGILQIDAHADLRDSYEGFTFSHASVMHNALRSKQIEKLVQVGVRDICPDEQYYISHSKGRVNTFYDWDIREKLFDGTTWSDICSQIIEQLPQKVYVSFDIDGLDPSLCPDTGTPVPGGLDFSSAIYLIQRVVKSGREIIGFDLCEVSGKGNEWNAIVGARILYRMCTMMAASGN